jgi:hypothetical protein
MALAASAQIEVTNLDPANFGITAEKTYTTDPVAAGTVCASTASVTCSNAFANTYQAPGMSYNKVKTVVINGEVLDITTALANEGLQGKDNPKDANNANPATSLTAPATGAVFQFDVAANGYLVVVGKFTGSKNYGVIEDGSYIGYDMVYDGTSDGNGIVKITPADLGADADNYINAAIKTPDEIKGLTTTGKNGVGVIGVPVYAGSSYLVFAAGSKISVGGFAFIPAVSTFDNAVTELTLTRADDTGALESINLLADPSAVAGIAEAKAEAKAPVKVITANGVQIGNYNIAGQQVK